MKNGLKVAVVGATGAVGRELLTILEGRNFPVEEILLFASPRSEGKVIQWKGKSQRCRALKADCFKGVHIAFFDASDAVSLEWVPQAAAAGAWVVDNSSTFRLEKDVLLVVPEVNGDQLKARFQDRPAAALTGRERIVSGPNCVAVPMAVALKPIQDLCGIRRVVASTYQGTSGAGAGGAQELSIQTVGLFNQKSVTPRIFPHQIAFNCIPHIGSFQSDDYTSEEQKIVAETRKLLDLPELRISATAVRVPTFSCHAISLNVECLKPFDLEKVRAAISSHPGILLQDQPKQNIYPIGVSHDADPVKGATGQDTVNVGRLRRDPSLENGLNLWVVSDNLRKGAALNAIQVAEVLLQAMG